MRNTYNDPWPPQTFMITTVDARRLCRSCRKRMGKAGIGVETKDAIYHEHCYNALRDVPTAVPLKPIGCGKCLSCKMGHPWWLCERGGR